MDSLFSSTLPSASLLSGLQLLLDLAMKSLIVMLAAWALIKMLRQASAAARHWVWSAAISSLLALPVLSLLLPNWQLGLLPSLTQRAAIEQGIDADLSTEIPGAVPGRAASSISAGLGGQSLSNSITSPPRPLRFEFDASDTPPVRSPNTNVSLSLPSLDWSLNWGAAALMFWLAGALLVMARLLTGTFKIWRLATLASQVTEGTWISLARNMAEQLRLRSNVELRQSEKVRLPMTWGAWRSVVMLPADADEWPQECRSIVLLHELAHVKRRDCLTQNLAQLACAIYWFNPLVWLAAKQLHVERELACDDQVLEVGTKASEYATHLVEIAKSFNSNHELSLVTVGMACSQLESRVRSILDPAVQRRGLNRWSAGLIGTGAICLILSLAVAQPWSKTAASSRSAAATQKRIGGDDELPVLAPALQLEPQVASDLTDKKGEALAVAQRDQREAEDSHAQEEAEARAEAEADARREAQDSSQSKTRNTELTADQIIEMRAAGVTPEFVEAMRKQGFDNLTVRELTQLSVHGINADYIKQARSWGGDKLTVRDIVNLKIAGVTPEYIGAMKQVGQDGLTARQLSELRIQGVTPEFVETMRRLGYDRLTANQLATLKVHGIDEAFVKEMQSWTGGKPTINELTQIKIHGVTPEFARQMKALGYDNLSIGKLTEMRIHGVDEAYIKEMRGLGFDNLTVNQLIQMRIHGVDADYVKKMRAAGLKNVSVNQMIEMKITGIDSILLKDKDKDKH